MYLAYFGATAFSHMFENGEGGLLEVFGPNSDSNKNIISVVA